MRGQSFQIIKLFNKKIQAHFLPRYLSTFKDYTVKEYEIPTPQTFIAGKLWEGSSITGVEKDVPIIAIHGWLDNCNSFDPLLSMIMAPQRTVYAMDLPGHGRSPLGTRGFFDGLSESMLAIHRIMTHFGWEKVILLGHSMGSIISFNFSGIFPEFVHAYIGMDVIRAIPTDYIRAIRRIAQGVVQLEKKLAKNEPPSYSYDELVQRTYKGRKESVSMEGCKILLERGAIKLPNNMYRFSHDLRVTIPASTPVSAETSRKIAENVQCPVCLIKGDPGQYYESKESFMEFVEFVQQKLGDNFEFHMIPGTHHFHLNDPEPVAAVVSRFLDHKIKNIVQMKKTA